MNRYLIRTSYLGYKAEEKNVKTLPLKPCFTVFSNAQKLQMDSSQMSTQKTYCHPR